MKRFLLVKELDKDDGTKDRSEQVFDSESELEVHLVAMWKFTAWKLVAVVKL